MADEELNAFYKICKRRDEEAEKLLVDLAINGEKSGENDARTAVFIAVKYGWIDRLRQLLSKDKTQLDYTWDSACGPIKIAEAAINVAVKFSQFEALEYLMAKGADLRVVTPKLIPSVLYLVCRNTDDRFFYKITELGVDLDQVDGYLDGSNVLSHFVYTKNFVPEKLRFLLDNGANVTSRNDSGLTAIHTAVREKNHRALKMLLQRVSFADMQVIGAIPLYDECCYSATGSLRDAQHWYFNGKDKSIFTYAFTFESLQVINWLWPFMDEKHKIRVCDESKADPCLLHSALSNKEFRAEIVKFLLENGFDANLCVVRKHGKIRYSPLDILKIHRGSGEMNPRTYNSDDSLSLLGCAIAEGQSQLISLLIKHGAHVNPSSDSTVPPLYVACSMGWVAMCKLLLSHGANPNCRLRVGAATVPTVLTYIYLYENSMLLELLKAGADLRLLSQPFLRFGRDKCLYKKVPLPFELLAKAFTGQTLDIPAENERDERFGKLKRGRNRRKIRCLTVDKYSFMITNFMECLYVGNGFTSLKHLCRVAVIQQILKARNWDCYQPYVDQLLLPKSIKAYLKYQTLD